jgi:hypothetical protein
MPALRVPALLIGSLMLAACGGGNSTPSSSSETTSDSTPSPTATTTTTEAATGRFVSTYYGYTVKSPGWSGTSASTAWNGTALPSGDTDPAVDTLAGPDLQRTLAYAGPVSSSLEKFAATSRAENAELHQCPKTPEATRRTTIDGERAIVEELYCPDESGVFTLTASVIHAGQVYVFCTFDQPGKEARMRHWFDSLLQGVSFTT